MQGLNLRFGLFFCKKCDYLICARGLNNRQITTCIYICDFISDLSALMLGRTN